MTSTPFITEQNDPTKPPFSERERHLLDALLLAERQRDQLLTLAGSLAVDGHGCTCSYCVSDRAEFVKLKTEINAL